MQCTQYQSNGHTVKFCSKTIKCGRCGDSHSTQVCSNDDQKCIHCLQQHSTIKDCPVYQERKYNTRQKIISRSKFSYAEMLKNAEVSLPTSNNFELLYDVSEEAQDNNTSQYSFVKPVKRRKKANSPTQSNYIISPTPVDTPQIDRASPSCRSIAKVANPVPAITVESDYPPLPTTQDVPGFQKISNDNSDPNIHEGLKYLIDLLSDTFQFEKRWIDLLNKLIPVFVPLAKKLCDKMPLLSVLLHMNG